MIMTTSRSLARDVLQGALGFALVSLAAFSVWAFAGGWFRGHGGELAMYGAIAVIFLGLSGLALGGLAGGAVRFYQAFLPAFFVYSVVWCIAWFGLPDKRGEWLGSILGGVVFTLISFKILGGKRGLLGAALVFVVLHSAGYFAGDWAMHGYWQDEGRRAQYLWLTHRGFAALAKLSWGLCYGLGFGAGIGWVFHRARLPLEPAAK